MMYLINKLFLNHIRNYILGVKPPILFISIINTMHYWILFIYTYMLENFDKI